jgi:hypothetical protein
MPEKKLPLIMSSGWFMLLWSPVSTVGRMERNGFLLLLLLSDRLHGNYYLESSSIIALE